MWRNHFVDLFFTNCTFIECLNGIECISVALKVIAFMVVRAGAGEQGTPGNLFFAWFCNGLDFFALSKVEYAHICFQFFSMLNSSSALSLIVSKPLISHQSLFQILVNVPIWSLLLSLSNRVWLIDPLNCHCLVTYVICFCLLCHIYMYAGSMWKDLSVAVGMVGSCM